MPDNFETDARLAARFLREYPLEAARLLDDAEPSEAVEILADAAETEAAGVLQFMSKNAAECLVRWPESNTAPLLQALSAGTTARLLKKLAPETRKAILARCPESFAKPVRRLLQYPKNTAGALMDPNPFTLPGDASAGEARRQLAATDSRVTDYLYVTDRRGRLIGVLGGRALFRAPSSASLEALMQVSPVSILAHADRRTIAAHSGWQRFHALPVVGHDNQLVGVFPFRNLQSFKFRNSKNDRQPLLLELCELYWTTLAGFSEGFFGVSPAGKTSRTEEA